MTDAIRMLAMIVGGVVVANTMIMAIYERTREIGRCAVGWRRWRILSQIMQESLYLCLTAALFGSVLGVIMLALLVRLPYMNGFLRAELSPGTFLTATALALLLGLLGGIYPAWRASKLQPVEALRYE